MNVYTLWNQFSEWIMQAGLPTVAVYHMMCGSAFLNVSASDAEGIEKVANMYLIPVQYLLAGHEAKPVFSETGEILSYHLEQRFNYEDPYLWIKTAGAYCALPSSLIIGGALKGVSYFSENVRQRHRQIASWYKAGAFVSNNANYESMGITLTDFDKAESVTSQGYPRRPGDELKAAPKAALQAIVSLLNEHNIVYWLDCGTCLGAYRHGGTIPWDWDIDLAILQPDFDNVHQILQKLDPDKYMVQDWSSRDKPKTYLKVYVKEVDMLIDLYHFAVDAEQKTVHSILSNEGSIFLPESWRIRERKYIMPTAFDVVFPLKKIMFDGIDAYAPNQIQVYLEQRYDGDISPARVYSEETNQYEKVLSHPYWKVSSR